MHPLSMITVWFVHSQHDYEPYTPEIGRAIIANNKNHLQIQPSGLNDFPAIEAAAKKRFPGVL